MRYDIRYKVEDKKTSHEYHEYSMEGSTIYYGATRLNPSSWCLYAHSPRFNRPKLVGYFKGLGRKDRAVMKAQACMLKLKQARMTQAGKSFKPFSLF